MTVSKKVGRIAASAAIFALVMQCVALPSTVSAHQSPGSCNGNRLNVGISKDKTEVQQGDILMYTVSRSNMDGGGGIACDFTNVSIDVRLPAVDGTPTGAIVNVVSGANYPAGTPISVIATIPYTVNVNADVVDIVAQVTSTGTLHDAPVDHTASILKTIGTSVVRPVAVGSGSGAAAGGTASALPGLPKTGVPLFAQ